MISSWGMLAKTRLVSNFGYCHSMPVTLPLNKMTLPEKLQIMESIWEDLSRHCDTLESPEWHNIVLQRREKQIATGKARFSNWERAKADIRRRVS